MIDENTLMSFAHFFNDERQLEKDYLINLMLKAISVNKFSNNLEFKGGTALYIFHGLDRFSEDLDFAYIDNGRHMPEQIDSFVTSVIRDFGLSYRVSKNKGNVVVKDSKGTAVGTRTELFIEGPLFDRTGVRHKIKIDISMRCDTIMKPEAGRFVSKYADIGMILTYKMPIGEMLAEKFCAIMERVKARDLYDTYFMLKFKDVAYDEGMLIEKLRRRNEEFDRSLIMKSVHAFKENLWKEELSYMIKNLPELREVKKTIVGGIS